MSHLQNGQQHQYMHSPQMHNMNPMGAQQNMMGMPSQHHHSHSHSPQMNHMNPMTMNRMNYGMNNQMNPMMGNQQTQHQPRYNNMGNNMMMNRNTMNTSNTQNNQNQNNNNNNNNSNNNNNNNQNNGNKGPTKDTWISPFKNRDQNIDFFMYAYKCQPCPLRRNCQSKVTCPGWHHEGEKRRNPGEDPNYFYSEEPCPNVKPQGTNKWQPPSRCTDGDDCGYSHTLLEQMYHPNIYKTSMCINFTNPQGNKCQWGFYCTHAHGQEDIRNPNKKSASNDNTTSNTNDASKTNDDKGLKKSGDSSTNTNIKDNNLSTSHQSLLSDKKKIDKRLRSQSAQSHLPTYHGNSDPNIYSNGHMRSPQFGLMNQSSHTTHSGHTGGHSHNLTSNHLPPPHSMQYTSYNSPPSTSTTDPHLQHTSPPNTSTPPRVTSHRADFSPVPYTAAAARQFAANPPPQLNLHDPNTMYHHSTSHTQHNIHHTVSSHHTQSHQQQSYAQDPSYVAYSQFRKRGRSISADTGLLPYVGTNKASQQPNMYPRYASHDPLTSHHYPPPPNMTQQQPAHTQHAPPTNPTATTTATHPTTTVNDELPPMAPSLGDGTRVSQTYLPKVAITKPQSIPSGNVKTKDTALKENSNTTPPPPNAEQVKNNPHNFLLNRDITFQDSSLLQPPRAVRSKSGGNLQYASHSGGNYPYLPNVDSLSGTKIKALTSSASLPSKVATLSNDKMILFAKTPADLGQRRRNRSGSEPLPPLPKYNMISDSIWRTNPNQEAPPGGSNPNNVITPRVQRINANAAAATSAQSNPKDAFQKRLMAMPENNATLAGVFSPDSQFNIDNIITPRDMVSPHPAKTGGAPVAATKQPQEKNDASAADWSYFGFSQEDILSPVPSDHNNNNKGKKINVPKTPPFSKQAANIGKPTTAKNKDEEIRRLKKQLEVAVKTIDKLSKQQQDKKVKKEKSDENKHANDDEKEPVIKKKENDLQQQQLARYKHFITCPSCKTFDPKFPRNQVLVPCGHLICGKCTSQSKQNGKKCPICQKEINQFQLLIIG